MQLGLCSCEEQEGSGGLNGAAASVPADSFITMSLSCLLQGCKLGRARAESLTGRIRRDLDKPSGIQGRGGGGDLQTDATGRVGKSWQPSGTLAGAVGAREPEHREGGRSGGCRGGRLRK